MATDTNAPIVAFVTCPQDQSDSLATMIVTEGLAACVNINDTVKSVYMWEGQVHRDTESLLIIKTTAGRLADIDALLAEHHPYSVYELIGMSISEGNADYIAWLQNIAASR